MSDLISRQDAIDAVCKACTLADDDPYTECVERKANSTFCDYIVALRQLPSAQPEIIRCKDCKHLFENNGCPLRTWWTHTEEDFCSYAERRSDG